VGLAALVALVCANADRVAAGEPFPPSTAAEVGISGDAIEVLGEHVSKLIEKEAVVGAELHIIKNRRTVFHRAYGWADRDNKRPLKKDAIYCVRSMTKPFVGTAIQMLIDDGKLSLDQRVSEILASRPLRLCAFALKQSRQSHVERSTIQESWPDDWAVKP